jgi:hypothetical protein
MVDSQRERGDLVGRERYAEEEADKDFHLSLRYVGTGN